MKTLPIQLLWASYDTPIGIPTEGGESAAFPTEGGEIAAEDFYYCYDGYEIPSSWVNDGSCDCSECEDEFY